MKQEPYDTSIASRFDDNWHFSDKYESWMMENILKYLKLQSSDNFFDIGGGTGRIVKRLKDVVNFNIQPTIVEPNLDMLNIARHSNVHSLHIDALEFSKLEYTYDAALMKENIHFIGESDLSLLFQGICNQLKRLGRILIITRPPNTTLPLFKAAKKIFYEKSIETSKLTFALESVGFDVEVFTESQPLNISLFDWSNFLRERSISTMCYFNDEQLESGIQSLLSNYDENIEIRDKLSFIVAKKL